MHITLSTGKAATITTGLALQVALGICADLPDLARLKTAAEAGDRVAQFEYGSRLAVANPPEQFVWIGKSARQGHAPAQDAMAGHLAELVLSDPKQKQAGDREAVRWASRAAFQGMPEAQLKLVRFYEGGIGVGRNPASAYMWAQIAVQSAGEARGGAMLAQCEAERDRIIAKTSSELIAEGHRRAAAFKPAPAGRMNPVEADLVFSQLVLSAIFETRERTSAVVNNVRFAPGETKDVRIDQQKFPLTCLVIEGKTARFGLAGTEFQTILLLKR